MHAYENRFAAEQGVQFFPFPRANFMVLSDIHCYNTRLGIRGLAYQRMLAESKEIKMLDDSEELLDEALAEARRQQVDFLLICGDLTKDGELDSHQLVASKLQRFVKCGIPVYVINGNHDINNQRAATYTGHQEQRIPSITPEVYQDLYAPFGLRSSIYRDHHSLSYLAEPVPGLWMLALDSCRWRKGFRVDGAFSRSTMLWIESVLTKAQAKGIPVFGMMHHGVLEHFVGNEKHFKDYLVNKHQQVARLLAVNGLRAMFTGHFHCQDIAIQWFGDVDFLYDIETGSLVTYPCPYRKVKVEGELMEITSNPITRTASHDHGFSEYAFQRSYQLAELAVKQTLTKWRMSQEDIKKVAPQIIRAFQAHCVGNEEPLTSEVITLKGLGAWGRLVLTIKKPLLEDLWNNSPPADNHLSINLKTGEYK